MKKNRSLTVLLSASIVATSISLPTSGYAATPNNVLSTEKYNETIKSTEFISGELTTPSSKNTEDVVLRYIDGNKDKYKIGSKSAKESFTVKKQEQDQLGSKVVRLQQTYNGVPVWGSTQVAHVNNKGVLTVFSGTVIPDLDQKLQQPNKKVSSEEAVSIAEKELGLTPNYTVKPTSEFVVYTKDDTVTYAYHVHLGYLSPQPESHDYFVEAATGKVLDHIEVLHAVQSPKSLTGTATTGTGKDSFGNTKNLNLLKSNNAYYLVDTTRGQGIYTYDAQNQGNDDDTSFLPGVLLSNTTNSFTSKNAQAAVDAHAYAGVVYDYYKKVQGRNSYDGNGSKIISSVHFGQQYGNAFWSPELKQMVYGDGDGSTRPFTAAIDAIGHELTHAVTETSSNLVYQDESGALNESMSDIFGTLIEYYKGTNPDYLIGEDLFFQSGQALRSMSDPTQYGDPDHYSKRYTGSNQSKLVHTNSGIINKAAYLIAEGGTHYGVTVSGIGKEKMGKVFYRANTQYLTESATFSQARQATLQSAADLYGAQSPEVTSVKKAFDAIGVN
ncbi:M4 family metallopeptidase [Bacillus pseudomycoides]|uniref:M4 family metallopeptidase n=1 Tax=Bacillus pseudomycoides TaxID=64104 RepID=UPI000BF85B91|nr:M4 family metallopeptidase [Bacillus pseudomycoides]PEP54491.1 bacillolysin [Bacillus pseudomycoides]PGS02501.1 bacillolysin [Bacillus pseudomycoides]PHC94439.1 bacillolysin [Bacillus pseudomycoides]